MTRSRAEWGVVTAILLLPSSTWTNLSMCNIPPEAQFSTRMQTSLFAPSLGTIRPSWGQSIFPLSGIVISAQDQFSCLISCKELFHQYMAAQQAGSYKNRDGSSPHPGRAFITPWYLEGGYRNWLGAAPRRRGGYPWFDAEWARSFFGFVLLLRKCLKPFPSRKDFSAKHFRTSRLSLSSNGLGIPN